MNAKEKQVGGSHYKDMAIQPGEFIRANDIGWYEGNAIKYICRHKKKGQKQDLEKAIHYIELAMAEYDARRFPPEAYECADDVTEEAVEIMRKKAAPIIDAEEWEGMYL